MGEAGHLTAFLGEFSMLKSNKGDRVEVVMLEMGERTSRQIGRAHG